MTTSTTSLPLSLRATLPGRWYTDPDIFALEQARVFEELWICAARADELATPGKFRTVQIGRESVLLVRDSAGEISGFFNVCRHRGARLCVDEEGEVARTLRCPYHAWTYALDGKLVAAPHLAKMVDIDRSEYGLRKVHVREWLGYVWVCLAQQPPSFEHDVIGACTERLGDAGAIDRYQLPRLELGRRIRYEVKANWKLIVENFMECYHCAPIHPELTALLPEFAGGYAAQTNVGQGASFAAGAEGFTIDGRPGVQPIPGLADTQARRYFAITVKPQVFINLVPDHVILHRMYPHAPDHTIVECDWLFTTDAVAGGRDLDPSVEIFHRVNQQDFEACERCQPSMASRAYADGGVLVPSEHHITEFHQWLQTMAGS